MNVRIRKAADHLNDRVHFANVMEKLITETFACARAFHQAGDVDQLDGSGDNFLGVRDRRNFFQA